MLDRHDIAPETIRPISRAEYERMAGAGLFDPDERIELLRGVIVKMTPQGPMHADVCTRLVAALLRALDGRAQVRPQLPFAASDDSEPEPDLAVVEPGDHSRAHPSRSLLVVEVSDSSLRKDRLVKSDIYAEAEIPEYWVVDLMRQVVEVRTAPRDGRYNHLATFSRAERIQLVVFPDLHIAVSDFLPPR